MIQNIYIGQSNWLLDTPFEMKWDSIGGQFTRPNVDSASSPNRRFTIIPTHHIPALAGTPVEETQIRRIISDGGHEARQQLLPDSGQVYALYAEMDIEKPMIFLDANKPELLLGNSFFYNYFAPERNLMLDDQMILHSCYLLYKGEAILFTAPSGTGKSTQGDLWMKYRDAQVINGDRSLLGKKDGIWKAYGLPFAGTSGISHNVSAPIRAIIYLHQAPINHARCLPTPIAFRQLYDQITINSWNSDFTIRACELLENLVTEIPVYDFYCTKYQDAVDYMDTILYH